MQILKVGIKISCTNVLRRNINAISLERCTYKSHRDISHVSSEESGLLVRSYKGSNTKMSNTLDFKTTE